MNMVFKDTLKYYTEKIKYYCLMEIINRSQEKPSTTKVKILTIKKYINSQKEFTGEEENISISDVILIEGTEDLKNNLANIALFNKEEESKLQQEGFNQNYIFMKKLITNI